MNIEQENSSINFPGQISEPNQNLSFFARISIIMAKNFQQLTLEQITFIEKATQRTEQERQEVLNKGRAQLFIRLLSSSDLNIVNLAIHGIGNMAHYQRKSTQQIVKNGGLDRLLMIAKSNQKNDKIFQNTIWAIHNICADRYLNFDKIQETFVYFCQLIAQDTIKGEQALIYCLSFIWFDNDRLRREIRRRLEIMMLTNLIANVVRLLSHHNHYIVYRCLGIIWDFTLAQEQATNYILAYGIIQKIHPLIFSSVVDHRIFVCRIYMRITGKSEFQVDQLLKYPQVLQDLLVLFKNDEIGVGMELCYVFSGIVNYVDQIFGRELFEKCRLGQYFIQFMLRCQNEEEYCVLKDALQCFFDLVDGAKRFFHAIESTQILEKLFNMNLKPLFERFKALPQSEVQYWARKILTTFF